MPGVFFDVFVLTSLKYQQDFRILASEGPTSCGRSQHRNRLDEQHVVCYIFKAKRCCWSSAIAYWGLFISIFAHGEPGPRITSQDYTASSWWMGGVEYTPYKLPGSRN